MPVVMFRDGPMDGQTMAVPDSSPVQVYSADANASWPYQTSVDYTTAATSASISTWTYVPSADGSTYSPQMWQNCAPYWPTTTVLTCGYGVSALPCEPITQEEADRRLAETRARAHRNKIRRTHAIRKGRKLLLDVLTEQQKWQYARTRCFTVRGSDGRTFVLRKGGTTHELDKNGKPTLSHCIHLPHSYIDEDSLVAVKMMLETDCAEFRRIANTSQLWGASPTYITSYPQFLTDRAEALAAGFEAVNERFRQISVAARAAKRTIDTLGRAIQYADYARELEHQLVAEETGGIALPLAARQQYTSRALGHAEDIAGVPIAA